VSDFGFSEWCSVLGCILWVHVGLCVLIFLLIATAVLSTRTIYVLVEFSVLIPLVRQSTDLSTLILDSRIIMSHMTLGLGVGRITPLTITRR